VITRDFNVARITGTSAPQPPVVSIVPNTSWGNLGIATGGMQSSGDAQFLLFNSPSGPPRALQTFDLTTNPPSPGVLISDALGAVDTKVIGPDGCLYSAAGLAVYRFTDASGNCVAAPTPLPPSISLTPVSANPQTGNSQSFAATLHHTSSLAGTPIYFLVSGANVDAQQQPADANGQAQFSYSGTFTGTDNAVAFTPAGSNPPLSNTARVVWAAGKDVTFLGLNNAPTSAMPSQAVTVNAQLTDISQSPPMPLQNEQINFAIGSGNCQGTTDSNGVASCQLTPSGNAITTLTADFAGTNSLAASHAQSPFSIVQPAAQPTPVAGALRIAPKRLNFGTILIGNSKTRKVTIKNLGRITKKKTAVPITIEVESASSPDAPSPFSVTMDCPPDDQLVPGAKGQKPGKCQVFVEFAPQAAQAFTGTLSIFDNLEPNLVQTVPLTGKGKAPKH
jgi:hypothetical protein